MLTKLFPAKKVICIELSKQTNTNFKMIALRTNTTPFSSLRIERAIAKYNAHEIAYTSKIGNPVLNENNAVYHLLQINVFKDFSSLLDSCCTIFLSEKLAKNLWKTNMFFLLEIGQ